MVIAEIFPDALEFCDVCEVGSEALALAEVADGSLATYVQAARGEHLIPSAPLSASSRDVLPLLLALLDKEDQVEFSVKLGLRFIDGPAWRKWCILAMDLVLNWLYSGCRCFSAKRGNLFIGDPSLAQRETLQRLQHQVDYMVARLSQKIERLARYEHFKKSAT